MIVRRFFYLSGLLLLPPVLSASGAPVLKPFESFAFQSDAGKKIDPALTGNPEGSPVESLFVWVQFRDKGFETEAGFRAKGSEEEQALSERTLRRRAKMMPEDALVGPADLPIEESYVAAVAAAGGRIRSRSRWFNAVGVEADEVTVRRIARLPFVYRIAPIARESRPMPAEFPGSLIGTPRKESISGVDYGVSLTQISQISVDALHARGLTGKGVVVGVLDAGFAPFSVSALDHAHVLAQRDFVDRDNSPSETPDHGTSVLSVLGGYAPGSLVGPAYGASFLLGRTEIIEDGLEIQLEEDLWVEGLEWLEREGADVVNSSLGYSDWYSAEDYDGATAVTTIAADLAVQRGVFIANSVGNEGLRSLVVPADGFFVCAVGGVYSSGESWPGSSRGPTADGRIKPDVSAMGVSVWHANSLFRDLPMSTSMRNGESGGVIMTATTTVQPGQGGTHLWLGLTLRDDSVTDTAWLGRPVLNASGVTVHLIRGATPYALWMNDFSNPAVLTAAYPDGFGYEGDTLSFAAGGIETTIPNRFDVTLVLDLSSDLPPGGIFEGDIIMVRTTTELAPSIGLEISYLDDGLRSSFVYGSGTSYASPLVAGAAALILEARPGWTPIQVLNALRATASQADSPDNEVGYGIANAERALFDSGEAVAADLSGDGLVNAADLLIFLRDWDDSRSVNESVFGPAIRSDLDLSGRIDDRDLFRLSTDWEKQ
jgi:subtilisin family serine protease